jgi:hypothetical protein
VTDTIGEVYRVSGTWLPLGLGPQCLVGIEHLPDSPQATTWHASSVANLAEVVSALGVALPNLPTYSSSPAPIHQPGRPPSRIPRGGVGGGRPATALAIPASVKIEYHLVGKSADGVVTIKKHYELKAAAPSDEPSPLTVTGDGTVLYDSHSHLVRSLQLKGKLVCDGKDSSLEIPFTYAYKQIGVGSSATVASSALPPASTPAQSAAPAEPAAAETAEAAKPVERAPLPDEESRQKASKLVEEVFGD